MRPPRSLAEDGAPRSWRADRLTFHLDDAPQSYTVPPEHVLLVVGLTAEASCRECTIFLAVDDREYFSCPVEMLPRRLGTSWWDLRSDDPDALYAAMKRSLVDSYLLSGPVFVAPEQRLQVWREGPGRDYVHVDLLCLHGRPTK
jgi:hypothetical protein